MVNSRMHEGAGCCGRVSTQALRRSMERSAVADIPKIISVDDHVVEPVDLWERFLPARLRERGPKVKKLKGRFKPGRSLGDWVEDDEGQWSDVWVYADLTSAVLP